MSGYCALCQQDIDPGTPADILDHLRVMHPDEYGDGPLRWPDGGLVITVDESSDLTVEDFTDQFAYRIVLDEEDDS